LMIARAGRVEIYAEEGTDISVFTEWEQSSDFPKKMAFEALEIEPSFSREEYLERAEKLMWHIRRGDIYEVNFCQEFHARGGLASPVDTWLRLTGHSSMPFSAYWSDGAEDALCASPERFLLRRGNCVVSQPMKGTIARGSVPEEDEKNRKKLQNDPKERAENVMIVDLVRNDLSKTAERGSVE